MKKDVTTTKNEVGHAQDLADWGAPAQLSTQDVVIPCILLMQYTSKLVKNQEAAAGEFRNSIDQSCVGGLVKKELKPLEIIPFYVNLCYTNMDASGTKEKYVGKEPINMSNDDAPREFMRDGIAMRRYRTYEVYFFKAGEVVGLPYVMTFKSTSMQAGRKIYSQMYATNYELKLPPPAFHMSVWPEHKENDKGEFFVLDAKRGSETTPEEMAVCLKWFKRLKTEDVKVDESHLRDDGDATPRDNGERAAKQASSRQQTAKKTDYQDENVDFGNF